VLVSVKSCRQSCHHLFTSFSRVDSKGEIVSKAGR
jgi:hypothetical protein